jgi:hypothetical protein
VRLVLVRASDYHLERAGVPAGRSLDGWSQVYGDPAAAAAAARSPALVIEDGPTLTIYAPDGSVAGPLDGSSGPDELRRVASLTGLAGEPGAAEVLRAALAPHGDPELRLADLCRTLGVPLDLVFATGEADAAAAPVPGADVGVVLMRSPVPAVAASAPLTRQSAWAVPLGPQWTWLTWDGDGAPAPLPAVAATLSSGEREPALAYWWSPHRGGFVLAVKGHVVAAHEWGAGVPVDVEATGPAAGALSREFRVSDQRLAIVALLRRDDPPADLLIELLGLLRIPTDLVGLGWPAVVDRAAGTPDAVHTPRLSTIQAIGHAVRERPPSGPLDRVLRERPLWYRVLNLVVGITMALSTVVLFVARAAGASISVWWLVTGVVTTALFLRDARPRRKRP